MPALRPPCERRERSRWRRRRCHRRHSVDLLPCCRARSRARCILARPLPPTGPEERPSPSATLRRVQCHSTGWRGRCGDDGDGGEAGDSGRERVAVEDDEEKLASWTAAGREAALLSALSARSFKRTAVAATVTRASLTKPKSRSSMARPPPRLAERARLCTRPDGGRPRTRPTSWERPEVQIKRPQPFSGPPPPRISRFPVFGRFCA